jgi:hypothetical protein
MSNIEAGVILSVTRELIGETEPCGDSAIDCKRMQNLEKLIYVVDELLRDVVETAAIGKDRIEGSMKDIGEKAYTELIEWHDYIENYFDLKGE